MSIPCKVDYEEEINMDYKKLGQRIRAERTGLNLTREKLAELLDLSPNFVGHIERGEKKMSLETLVRIASALHVSLDYLVYGDNISDKADTSKLQKLIGKCSQQEISLVTDIIKSMLLHLKSKKQ